MSAETFAGGLALALAIAWPRRRVLLGRLTEPRQEGEPAWSWCSRLIDWLAG